MKAPDTALRRDSPRDRAGAAAFLTCYATTDDAKASAIVAGEMRRAGGEDSAIAGGSLRQKTQRQVWCRLKKLLG